MNNEILQARRILEQRPIYLDTETTGLDGNAEICQIAILDQDGTPLLDTLVRPVGRISNSAIAIHGITNERVEHHVPPFSDLRAKIFNIMHGRMCVTYNAEFDMRMLMQSAVAAGCRMTWGQFGPQASCAMLLYADYRGEWNEWRQSNRWFKLDMACTLEHIPMDGIRLHSAAGDAELTRRLVRHIAGQKLLWEKTNAALEPIVIGGAE